MGICHHLEIGTKNEKLLENLVSSLITSCNDGLSADMPRALHKHRVHCSGITQ